MTLNFASIKKKIVLLNQKQDFEHVTWLYWRMEINLLQKFPLNNLFCAQKSPSAHIQENHIYSQILDKRRKEALGLSLCWHCFQ